MGSSTWENGLEYHSRITTPWELPICTPCSVLQISLFYMNHFYLEIHLSSVPQMTGIPDHNVVQEMSPFNSPTQRAPVVLIPCLAFAH